MENSRTKSVAYTEPAILGRAFASKDRLTKVEAQRILKVRFSSADMERMGDLLEKNRNGQLSAAEVKEMDVFDRVGDLISIMHAQARQVLGIKAKRPKVK